MGRVKIFRNKSGKIVGATNSRGKSIRISSSSNRSRSKGRSRGRSSSSNRPKEQLFDQQGRPLSSTATVGGLTESQLNRRGIRVKKGSGSSPRSKNTTSQPKTKVQTQSKKVPVRNLNKAPTSLSQRVRQSSSSPSPTKNKKSKTKLERGAEFINKRSNALQENTSKELQRANNRSSARRELSNRILKKFKLNKTLLAKLANKSPDALKLAEKTFIGTKGFGGQLADATTKIGFVSVASVENVRKGQGKQLVRALKAQGNISSEASRLAMLDAVKSPETYALALLAPASLAKGGITKVVKTTKIPKTGAKGQSKTIYINEKTGSVRVTNAKGKIESLGRIKDAKGVTTRRVNEALEKLGKLDKRKTDVRRINNEIEKVVNPSRSKSVKNVDGVKLRNSKSDKQIKRSIDSTKKTLQSIKEAKTTKQKAKLQRKLAKQLQDLSEKTSINIPNNAIVPSKLTPRNVNQLITRQNKALAKKKVIATNKAKKTRAKNKRAKEEADSPQQKLQRVIDKQNKAKDVKAQKLGFKNNQEYQSFLRNNDLARNGNILARAKLKLLERRISKRTSKESLKAKRRLQKAVFDADRAVIVKAPTRKLSKSKKVRLRKESKNTKSKQELANNVPKNKKTNSQTRTSNTKSSNGATSKLVSKTKSKANAKTSRRTPTSKTRGKNKLNLVSKRVRAFASKRKSSNKTRNKQKPKQKIKPVVAIKKKPAINQKPKRTPVFKPKQNTPLGLRTKGKTITRRGSRATRVKQVVKTKSPLPKKKLKQRKSKSNSRRKTKKKKKVRDFTATLGGASKRASSKQRKQKRFVGTEIRGRK